ncbi:MAG: zinc ABC transporter substrate-binding protein [Clostridiales bacterium]|nr:zinc ABC transporter substrate-binding protein [Clostridiales bacterium]
MLAGCFAGCSTAGINAASKKTKIVTTIFPEYDWVMNVLGDKASEADVTMLLDNGVDLHSFQPNASDIMKISTCDVFIYIGGESDAWVDDALKESVNKDMIVVNLLDTLGDAVKEEEVVEGMQEEDEEDHDHDHANGDPEEIEYDEHVWLSLHNSATLVEKISEALQKADPSNAETYKTNAAGYMEKINALDKQYHDTVDNASCKTILFGDRFPFRYLVDDYGLSYYAAFVGCSAETEASFETITFLAGKVDELGLKVVMTIEGSDNRIAETIIQNTESKDQKILSVDSMQSVTSKDVAAGASYLDIMTKNLDVLKEALG